MSLDVSKLATYTDQLSTELISKTLLKGNTISSGVQLHPGIKSNKDIHTLETSLYLQAGACGWTESGTTALGKVNLAVDDVKFQESICLDTLEDLYTQYQMNPGSYNEDIPFEEYYVAEKQALLSKEIDKLIWQGNKSTGSGNMSLANGLLQYLDQSAISALTSVVAPAAWTVASAITQVDALVAALPADLIGLDDLVLFCSHAQFQVYMLALRNANYFHFAPDFNPNMGLVHPGTNILVKPFTGLIGSTRHILTPLSNTNIGFDLMSDVDSFKIWWSQDNLAVRVHIRFKIGSCISFPSMVVLN
jgi:hypothetical protein